MFKIFYPKRSLNLKPFCLQVKDIRCVLSDPDSECHSVLVLESEVVYDIADDKFYTRILVKGSVADILIKINN